MKQLISVFLAFLVFFSCCEFAALAEEPAESPWSTAASALSGAWHTTAKAFSGAWNAVSGALGKAWKSASGTVSGAARGAWGAVSDAVSGALNAVSGAVSAAWSASSSAVSGAARSVGNAVKSLASSAADLAARVWNWITEAAKKVAAGAAVIWFIAKNTVFAEGTQTLEAAHSFIAGKLVELGLSPADAEEVWRALEGYALRNRLDFSAFVKTVLPYLIAALWKYTELIPFVGGALRLVPPAAVSRMILAWIYPEEEEKPLPAPTAVPAAP